jgi:putative transposase
MRHQCELLGMSRNALYYQPKPESREDLELMRWLDEEYLRRPFYGYRRMTQACRRAGRQVNEKRVRRLLRLMGIEAIYPKRNLSAPGVAPWVLPYLLKGLAIKRAHQVWAIDITYLPMKSGFGYLAAIIDWHSRYVLSWRVSNSLEGSFCMECLEEALDVAQCVPQIINSDQGSQFTSKSWVETVELLGAQVSHDGKRRAIDNVMIERLWRSVKYEDVYPNGYEDPPQARAGLEQYFAFYNTQRPHQSLDYQTPMEILRASSWN